MGAQADGYQFVEPGILAAEMSNPANRYMFYDPASELYGYLLPNRPVIAQYSHGSALYSLFTGAISDIRPQSDKKRAQIEAIDGIDYLRNREGDNIDCQTDIAVSEAIVTLLTSAEWQYADTSGWTFPAELGIDSFLGSSLIDNSGDEIPIWWGDPTKTIWEQIVEIARAFAGNPFVAADGTFSYQSRNAAPPVGSVLVDSDIMLDSDLQNPWAEVRNHIRITANPRSETATVDIWKLYDKMLLEVGETYTLWAEYQYDGEYAPRKSVVYPVATTDYTANTLEDGTGTDKTVMVSFGITDYATTAKLEICNEDSVPIYLTMFKLRGILYIAPNKTSAIASDSTSITSFNKRALSVDNLWIQERQIAEYHATWAKALFSDPRKILWVKIKNDPALQFGNDLFSEISIDIDEFGASGTYWITYIEHRLKHAEMITIWRLEPTPSNLGGFWIFDTELGETSILGW